MNARSVVVGSALPQLPAAGIARCGEDLAAIAQVLRKASVVVIVDASFLKGAAGTAFWESVRINHAHVAVVIDDPLSTDALEFVLLGCSAVIPPDIGLKELYAVVTKLLDGELVMPATLMSRALKALQAGTPTAVLTSREQEIFALVCAGLSNQAIAEQLLLSRDTIRWHLRSIHAKLGPVALRQPRPPLITRGEE